MADGSNTAIPVAREHVARFMHDLRYEQIPESVLEQARQCLLDLVGVAAAGARTRLSCIIRDHAVREIGSGDHPVRVLLDGRTSSRAGAALAGAATIDAFDAHDGHALTKGHAGVAVLPALLAFADRAGAIEGGEFLATLVLGYEIGTRAGIALHATVHDYHCSGAWNAVACAAVGARRLALDLEPTRHALGIAEYFGPRGQMLRVCAQPSMLKDGSGWGAHAGVTAALLAAQGFTGAPAVTTETDDMAHVWSDLGTRWRIAEQYFKAYPVCRWAQPAIEAALTLARQHGFTAADIVSVHVTTFREAIVLGANCAYPRSTEEAQYSLAYPVAAALARGRVGAHEIADDNLADALTQRVFEVTTFAEDAAFSKAFPRERWARVNIALRDGRTLDSGPHEARGGPEVPLSTGELRTKYHELADDVLGRRRADRIEALAGELGMGAAAPRELVDELLAPIESR